MFVFSFVSPTSNSKYLSLNSTISFTRRRGHTKQHRIRKAYNTRKAQVWNDYTYLQSICLRHRKCLRIKLFAWCGYFFLTKPFMHFQKEKSITSPSFRTMNKHREYGKSGWYPICQTETRNLHNSVTVRSNRGTRLFGLRGRIRMTISDKYCSSSFALLVTYKTGEGET